MPTPLFAFASEVEFKRLFPSMEAPCTGAIPIAGGRARVAVLGVGLLEFSANLARLLSSGEFSAVYLFGICGAYKGRGIELGEVLRIDSETVGDLGVEEGDGAFTPWARVGGGTPKVYRAAPLEAAPPWLASLKGAAGITVNCCTGTEAVARMRSLLFDADVESMEGAAVFAVSSALGIPAYQVRAVSNFVGARNKPAWKISSALLSLKQVLAQAFG